MNNSPFTSIFKSGSKTYYYSSLFFPKEIKDDVFILYSFVRTADNFVDAIPQQKKAFYDFIETYEKALKGKEVQNDIINAFVNLMQRKHFDPKWVTAFLQAMEQDLKKTEYQTLEETEAYMYGSAEVIGLMMAAIMQLPKDSYTAAQKLGKAMQFINFIRDIQEDIALGRTYLPVKELKEAGLKSLQYDDVKDNQDAFITFIDKQLQRYTKWQKEAETGFHYIPKRYRIPIKTASDMYKFTGLEIKKNPYVVYQRKVKPSMYQVVGTGLKNTFLS